MVKVKERIVVDEIKQGTLDLVTDRSKSKTLSIVTALMFPIILLNLGITYTVSYVPDQVLPDSSRALTALFIRWRPSFSLHHHFPGTHPCLLSSSPSMLAGCCTHGVQSFPATPSLTATPLPAHSGPCVQRRV